ncbi:heterokaryon incompatibility protein-domain-containing protein [Suillus bovinus]|uniref:heterokaryon incompatibility protein-domain-containing protein n=1 Tax=Suillus bovinus TaxID=48563 RepID=UPI001B87E6F0|nr:heterokaryon incompatibility protein-domain-containing protein [Suillus bovinus]KAG2130196.1 heterokaryon incompatibility protein-domain-containing protein [Suillus bovinus]
MSGSDVRMVVDGGIGASRIDDNDFKELVEEVFDEYIINEMPIRLIHISEDGQGLHFKLVDRAFVKEHFKLVPDEIYREFCNARLVDMEDCIRERVKETLKYAIFSHRWLSSEPSYQDMSTEPMKVQAELEPKWQKLRQFCRKARDDHGCEFAWSDTCCINKTGSAELDESIRSMFRWYRNSHVCIVHLSETENLAALERQQKDGAKVDVWFTRGWTLQELLAPAQIKFYGRDWNPLVPLDQSKSDRVNDIIMRKIEKITNIPLEDLKSFEPGTNRVPQKMLWASKRRTSRTEDIAYCLIGIFNVSLMIAYGEGNRAFFRLMEEIIKRYDKWDVFLWSGQCSHYNATLPHAPRCYPVGYQETLVKRRHEVGNEEEWNTARYDIGDRLFALTNHGLQIKVLRLFVDLQHARDESHNSRYLTFRHTEFNHDVVVRHIGPKREPHSTIWAIAVLDYWADSSGKGFMDGRKDPFTAFLLSKDTLHASPDARWRKEMTEEVIKIQQARHCVDKLVQLYL